MALNATASAILRVWVGIQSRAKSKQFKMNSTFPDSYKVCSKTYITNKLRNAACKNDKLIKKKTIKSNLGIGRKSNIHRVDPIFETPSFHWVSDSLTGGNLYNIKIFQFFKAFSQLNLQPIYNSF